MKKILAALLMVVSLALPALAIIVPTMPVTDVAAMTQRQAIWGKELLQWAEQFKRWTESNKLSAQIFNKATENLNYQQVLAGNWKGVLAQMKGNLTNQATRGNVDLEVMGWRVNVDRWNQIAAQRSAVGAIGELRRVMDAQVPTTQVRGAVEEVWGVVPMTRDGVRVESMHQEMATVIAGISQLQQAIDEKTANAHRLDREISGAFGFRSPGEVERLKAKQNKETQDLSALQVTATNYTNRLLVQMVGSEASKISTAEQQRLREIRTNKEAMSMMRFSPKVDREAYGPGVE